MKLSARDHLRLTGLRPELLAIVTLAAELVPFSSEFIVNEGIRTMARQRELYAAGKSQTLNSRHLTGHAVDLVIWADLDQDKVVDADELSWKFPQYTRLAGFMKEAALQLGFPLVWGGDWKSLKDGPHFELDRRVFP